MRNYTLVKEAVESSGAAAVAEKINRQIAAKEVNKNNFSFRGLFEAFIGYPTEENIKKFASNLLQGKEDVRSDAFVSITKNYSFARLMEGYDNYSGVLDLLVDPIVDASKTLEIPGIELDGGIDDVPEGQEYNSSGMSDISVFSLEPAKRGRMVHVTEEAIMFDKTGLITRSLIEYGRHIALDRERNGIRRIQDITGYKSFYPRVNGIPTNKDLYATTVVNANNWYEDFINTKTSNALVDWTDIEAAWLLWKEAKDSKGDQILISPNILLVPYELSATANFILRATENRRSTNSGANVDIAENATRLLGLGLTPVTSPFLADTSTWYIGAFKQQFIEHVIIPPQVQVYNGDPSKDIVLSLKYRRKSHVVAVSNKYVIKNTA